MIELVQVEKSFDQFKALKKIDCTFRKNESYVLIGESGSGKSTLLNLIGLQDQPTSGEVFINGESTSNWNDSKKSQIRASQIGFVHQFFELLPHLSVLDNIILPSLLAGLSPPIPQAQSLIEKVGLKGRENSFPRHLSGGQQQRVAIARVAIMKPMLILADEPTGSLDTKNQKMVMDLLLEVFKETESIFIVATHSSHVARMFQNKLEIVDGELIRS